MTGDRRRSFGPLIYAATALVVASGTHGPVWKRMLLTFVFTFAGLCALSTLRAAWRDRWFWMQTWKEFTRAHRDH